MSVKMSQRDLDALRAGIEEQVRSDVHREISQASFDRIAKLPLVDRVCLVRGDQLRVGDVLVEAMGLTSYRARETVTRIADEYVDSGGVSWPMRPGNRWVEYEGEGLGSGGHAVSAEAQILIKERSEHGDDGRVVAILRGAQAIRLQNPIGAAATAEVVVDAVWEAQL